MPIQTEFTFRLPQGYLDAAGVLHRDGVMRLATAADEIAATKDPRVQANAAYRPVVLLARVVTRLGSVATISPKVIEGLFAADFACLLELYGRINGKGLSPVLVTCPKCGSKFELGARRLKEC
jgi:hypothetical protein